MSKMQEKLRQGFFQMLEKQKGKKFIDKEFPANIESLIKPENRPPQGYSDEIDCAWEDIKWKPAAELDDLKGKKL